MHPDRQRFTEIMETEPTMPQALAWWVDVPTLEEVIAEDVASIQVRMMEKYGEKVSDEAAAHIGYGLRRGFLLGVRFQAIGGHREALDEGASGFGTSNEADDHGN
jgi:hypothetical protein